MNLEKALRRKYRYPSQKGELTTEQLWDLPLTSNRGFDLDSVAIELNIQLGALKNDSFVKKGPNPLKTELEEKLQIVVHVIQVKMTEEERASAEATRRAERRKLEEILHLRTQAGLMSKTPEEIRAMIDKLDAPAAEASS